MKTRGAAFEEILTELRRASPSPIDSIRVIRDLEGIDLNDAKDRVHNSMTWRDLREDHAELHRRMWEATGRDATVDRAGRFKLRVDLRDTPHSDSDSKHSDGDSIHDDPD